MELIGNISALLKDILHLRRKKSPAELAASTDLYNDYTRRYIEIGEKIEREAYGLG